MLCRVVFPFPSSLSSLCSVRMSLLAISNLLLSLGDVIACAWVGALALFTVPQEWPCWGSWRHLLSSPHLVTPWLVLCGVSVPICFAGDKSCRIPAPVSLGLMYVLGFCSSFPCPSTAYAPLFPLRSSCPAWCWPLSLSLCLCCLDAALTLSCLMEGVDA